MTSIFGDKMVDQRREQIEEMESLEADIKILQNKEVARKKYLS